jgi:prevent-host-death family protein
MRPDRFRAVAGLSVPYRPRGPDRPTTEMPKTDGEITQGRSDCPDEGNRAFEAKSKLGQLLDWVGAGEKIIITRRGKAVSRMISADAVFDRERARGAAARIRARRRGMNRTAVLLGVPNARIASNE